MDVIPKNPLFLGGSLALLALISVRDPSPLDGQSLSLSRADTVPCEVGLQRAHRTARSHPRAMVHQVDEICVRLPDHPRPAPSVGAPAA